MTNNTIPNVPCELLETLIEQHITSHGFTNHTARQAQLILCAPSPAGVDGLEVVGWYRMDGRKDITPYPSVCATWHKMGVKVGAAYSDSAHAIIDGLRGEVAELRSMLATVSKAGLRVRTERDQQAQRIGELEGLLLRVQVSLSLDDTEWGYSGAEKYKLLSDIRAALSAGKEKQHECN